MSTSNERLIAQLAATMSSAATSSAATSDSREVPRSSSPTKTLADCRGDLRVGVVLPVMFCGGVERWLVSFLRGMAGASGVRVVGVAYLGDREPNAFVASEVARLSPILSIDRFEADTIALGSSRRAVETLAESVDVLLVWSIHGFDWLAGWRGVVVGLSHGCGDWWMSEARAWVDKWVAVSRVAARPIPARRDAVAILPNGVDARRLVPTMGRAQARASLGLSPRDRVVAMVARLSDEKQHAKAVEALASLDRDVRLVAVGEGPKRAELERLAAESAGRFVLAGERDDVGNVYLAADAALVASAHEGFCLALVEGMFANVPTATTRVGIADELVELIGFSPFEIAADSPAGIAAAIGSALDRGRGRGATRAIVANALRAHYSERAFARRWRDWLVSLRD